MPATSPRMPRRVARSALPRPARPDHARSAAAAVRAAVGRRAHDDEQVVGPREWSISCPAPRRPCAGGSPATTQRRVRSSLGRARKRAAARAQRDLRDDRPLRSRGRQRLGPATPVDPDVAAPPGIAAPSRPGDDRRRAPSARARTSSQPWKGRPPRTPEQRMVGGMRLVGRAAETRVPCVMSSSACSGGSGPASALEQPDRPAGRRSSRSRDRRVVRPGLSACRDARDG